MKKNGNTPGFQMPVSISDTPEISTENLRSVKNILLRIPEGALDSKTQDRTADAIATINHSEDILEHYYSWVSDLTQEKQQTVPGLSLGAETDQLKDGIAAIKSGLTLLEAATSELEPPESSYKRRIFMALREQVEHLILVADSVSKRLPDYSSEIV